MSEYQRGSEWRRWDLHIHTPETKRNDLFKGASIDEKWNSYYTAIDDYIEDGQDLNKSIAVIGITDYLCIDNYKKVINDNRLPATVKLILPNVEMRMTPVARTSPINIHCIFNPSIVEEIETRFFSRLKFNYLGREYLAIKSDLIALGKKYKDNEELDENQAYRFGSEQYVISPETLFSIFENDRELKENTIIIVSNKGNDGVSGTNAHKDYFEGKNSSLDAVRQRIYQMSDMIFSANESDIKYFLGKSSNSIEEVKRKCGSLKPCVHGCDAHSIEKIFEPDNNRFCWIKAEPTFEGLKQVIIEPEQRVRIAPVKPETKQDYQVIDRVEFIDEDFQEDPIYFNDKLNCIIGGKSTGKSILIQNMARKIDATQTSKHLKTSKRATKNDVDLNVIWRDGNDSERKIIYIPQTYLNQLSDEKESQTEIDKWVEEILLKNNSIKTQKELFDMSVNNYKIDMNKNILDFVEANNELKKICDDKLEIGNKQGITLEISKLQEEKEKIVANSGLSEDDVKSYDEAKMKVNELEKKKEVAILDKENLISVDNIVEEIEFALNLSQDTSKKLSKCKELIITETKTMWDTAKKKIIEEIDENIASIVKEIEPYSKTIETLKVKIESNETVKLLTNKITVENDKIDRINKLEIVENSIIDKRTKLIEKLYESGIKYKSIHKEYSTVVNDNAVESDGLLFSGENPFKREAFVETIAKIYHTNRTEFKSIINIESFDESTYTIEFLEQITNQTINGELVLKKGYTQETALREVLDNWYNIVYRVRMDDDLIEHMSPGKKALVLLKILISLAESKCPILIDQPEDDLDNRSIFKELITFIKEKKIDRQIIIVTHNANIVLGSDAENIIIANQMGKDVPNKKKKFEYRSGAIENNSSIYKVDGKTKEDGVLSQQGIQQHICDILEGGEQAFEIRKKKYRI